MDETGKSLLELMFNEDESICVSNNKFGYHSIPLKNVLNNEVSLISPNDNVKPSICNSSELILVAINPINGFRLDSNVTKFRTFLWEIDIGSIKDQLGYFKHVELPISALIFSGNKSIHALTILDEEIGSENTYKYLYNWALNILTMCDPNCKNSSRSVRIPGAYRDKDKKQRLIKLNGRVKLEDFLDWLKRYDHLRPKVREKRQYYKGGDISRLSLWAKKMLKDGIDFKKGRNATWYALGMDFALAGYSEEEAVEELGKRFEEERDFKEREWLTCISSAYKQVRDNR
jgi:hypothetical protein